MCTYCTKFILMCIARNSDRCVLHMNKGWCVLPINKGRVLVARNSNSCVWHEILALIGKMLVEWDETPNIWRLWRFSFFFWCFLLTCNPAFLFSFCVEEMKEKIISLKWWLVCGLGSPTTWPYSRPISPTLLQLLD